MTSLLEQRYRTVLRMLPRSYRERREDEMVDTYLEEFDEEIRDEVRPSLSEVASIAALAVRTRTGAAGGPARYAVVGATMRFLALLSVLVHAGRLLADNAMTAAWLGGAPVEEREFFLQPLGDLHLTGIIGTLCQWVLPLGWVVAYAALARDRRRLAKTATFVAALPTIWTVLDPVWGGTSALTGYYSASAAFTWLTVLAVCCGFHSDAPATRLPLAPPGLMLMGVCVLMGVSTVTMTPAANFPGSSITVCCAAGLLWFAARVRRAPVPQDPALPLALAGTGLAVLAEQAGMVVAILGQDGLLVGVPRYLLVAQSALAVLLVVALAVTGVRAARRVTRKDPSRGAGSAVG